MFEDRFNVNFLDKNAYSKKKKLYNTIKELVYIHAETLQACEYRAEWAAIT